MVVRRAIKAVVSASVFPFVTARALVLFFLPQKIVALDFYLL